MKGYLLVPSKDIPGADENTVESEIRASSSSTTSPKAKAGDGDVDDLLADIDEVKEVDPNADTIIIHFVRDGFTALEQMWYHGQELELEVGSPHWNATLDRNGDSWVLMDEAEQKRKYKGKVFFRPGPWPYDEYEDERARQAEKERARRPSHPNPGIVAPRPR